MNTKTISRLLLLLCFSSGFALNSSAQKKDSTRYQPMDSLYYAQKATKLNTTGWILTGAGLAVGIGGALVAHNHADGLDGLGDELSGAGLIAIGATAFISGVVLIVELSELRNKAMTGSVSMGQTQVQRLQVASVRSYYVPSLTLHIQF